MAAAEASKKSRQLTDALNLVLKREVDDGDGNTVTQAHAIANTLAIKARLGDVPAIKECFDRTEGKAAQALILQGDEDNPVVSKIVVEIID